MNNTCPPCSGTCQNARHCPTRQACELPIDDAKPRFRINLFALLVWLTALFTAAFVAGAAHAVWTVLVSVL